MDIDFLRTWLEIEKGEMDTQLADIDEKLAGSTERMYKIRRQKCVTECAASNSFGSSLQNDSGFFGGIFHYK